MMVYVVLMITNLGLGPNIETTGIVAVAASYERAEIAKVRAEAKLSKENRHFVIQEEVVLE